MIHIPQLNTEMTVRAAEHEAFLSFVNDEDCELFNDWWNTKGGKLFQEWAEKELKRRRRLS